MPNVYRKFSTYLKDKYGVAVSKISVNAGFSCPNRDGSLSTEGCFFCDNQTFNFQSRQLEIPSLENQIQQGIKAAQARFKAKKFIIYFQAHTNTYAPIDKLKEVYDIVKLFDDVVGISIGTRPDCINDEILDLIQTYQKRYEVWIEYGLQSIHPQTLKLINRGHTYEDFLNAVGMARKRTIPLCVHVILGLPNETKAMMLATAQEMNQIKIDGIKIHPLHIVKNTPLERFYGSQNYTPLAFDDYIDLLARFIAHLDPKTIVQRIDAYCPPEFLVAPAWVSERNKVEPALIKRLQMLNYVQGTLTSTYKGTCSGINPCKRGQLC